MNIKSNIAVTAAVSLLISIIATFIILGLSPFGVMISIVLLCLSLGEFVILYFLKRMVLRRKQNIFANISIVLMCVAYITAILDIKLAEKVLASWTSVLGMFLFLTSNYLLVSSLFAIPRHGKEEYDEKEEETKGVLSVHGPYDVVRHPINLSGLFFAFSIPLILGSAYAFIPAAISGIFIIAHAIVTENYRFENYSWYYDYTKRVPYMIMPVIW